MLQKLKANQVWHGQRVQFQTVLFGKQYYWLQDGDGKTYLAKIGSNGLPDLS